MSTANEGEPDVSVVIPTYNRHEKLEGAIDSCFEGNKAIDLEVIVVDDGSTDGTQSLMESLDDDQVRYIRQKNKGAQIARNRGLNEARGEFIKFLDDDDELVPAALETEVRRLRSENASVSCGNLLIQNDNRKRRTFRQTPSPDLISGIFEGSVWTHPPVFLYRTEVLAKCEWDPYFSYHQDTAFAVQATALNPAETIVEKPVAIYRNHGDASISNDVKSNASVCNRSLLQIEIIERGVRRLRENDAFRPHHRKAAARGMWMWAHIIAAYDLSRFSEIYEKIQSVNPGFAPSRDSRFLTVLDAIFGVESAEYLMSPARRLKRLLD